MNAYRYLIVPMVCVLSPLSHAGDKKGDATWARIVIDLITPEQSKKGIEFQERSLVKPESVINFGAKDLGAKLSIKAIRDNYGKPAKFEAFAVKMDGKIVTFKEHHYPPISFTTINDSDDVFLVSAPKKLWGEPGILEHAKKAGAK